MGYSNRVADWALWCQLYLDEMRKEHQGWNRSGACFFGTNVSQHSSYVAQRASEVLQRTPLEVEETAPKHPNVWALVGSKDSDILWVAEQIYRGHYSVAPSMFTSAEQEDYEGTVPGTLQMHYQNWPTEQKGAS